MAGGSTRSRPPRGRRGRPRRGDAPTTSRSVDANAYGARAPRLTLEAGSHAGAPGEDLPTDERWTLRDIARAIALRAQGESLYAIAMATGRSKEWLRTYAGITD